MTLDTAIRTIRDWNISRGTLRTTADERRLAVAQDIEAAAPHAERQEAERRVAREDAHLFEPPIVRGSEEEAYIDSLNRNRY